jgi:putative inorganic carbon (hco3(-)) transporter
MSSWQLARVQQIHLSNQVRALIWTIQVYGLMVITFLSFFPTFFRFEEHLFFGLFAVALAMCWIEGRSPWVRSPIDLPLFLFVGWVLLTVPFAIDPAYSFSEWRKLAAQVLLFYWVLLVLQHSPLLTMKPPSPLAPPLSPKSLSDIGSSTEYHTMAQRQQVLAEISSFRHVGQTLRLTVIEAILLAVVLGSSVLSAWSLVDFFERGGTWGDRIVRANAPGSDYNWLGTYAIMALPLAIVAGRALQEYWQRLLSWLACGLIMLALIFSYSRASWLGAVVQIIVLALLLRRKSLVVAVLVGIMAVIAGLLLASRAGLQQDTVDPWTWNSRMEVWSLGVQEISKNPLTGMGYGYQTFEPLIADYPGGPSTVGLHSTILMVALGSGIPAVLLILWTLGQAFSQMVKYAMRAGIRGEGIIPLAVALMVFGFTARNVFDYMFAGSLAYLFWILTAVALAKASMGMQTQTRIVAAKKS